MVIIVLCFVFWASKGLEGLTSMHFFMSFALVLQFVQEIDMLSAGTKEVKREFWIVFLFSQRFQKSL